LRVFAELYRRLDSATSTRAKQAALVDAFATARDDPAQRGSAAWMIYFLAGGKPRQTVPTRLLRRLAVELSGLPEWLCEECYHSVGDLAETLALLLPDRPGAEEVALATWMRERLLPLPALDEEQRYARLKDWVEAMPVDERLVFFKLITGELRVGVSRLQVIKALAEVSSVDESRMAQRMIGYAQARRAPDATDFAALIRPADEHEGAALDTGRAYRAGHLPQRRERLLRAPGKGARPPRSGDRGRPRRHHLGRRVDHGVRRMDQ
jgi:DNA ligase 1